MVRYARGQTGNGKKPLDASSWNQFSTQQANDKPQTLPVIVKPAKKRVFTKFTSVGLDSYQSDSEEESRTPGIAAQLLEIAPAPAAMEEVKPKKADLPNNKTKKRKRESQVEKVMKNTKDKVKEEVERIKKEKGAKLTNEEEAQLSEYVKKDQRREERRLKREDERKSNVMCFNCRQTGHAIADCPKTKGRMDQGTGICFKCGSTEHSVNRCRVKLPAGEYPYAKCFICGEMGHMASQCPDNPRGLYPKGGCCNMCGSVEHFKKDCPEHLKQQGVDDFRLGMLNKFVSPDDEESFRDRKVVRKKDKKHKVVKF